MKKLIALLCILSALILFVSCDNPTSSNGSTIETISWDPDGSGYRQFSTNDDQYYDYYFTYALLVPIQDPMQPVEVNVKKISGYEDMGYGIIFCRQDGDNYYILLIDINGYYFVSRKVSGTFTTLIDWGAQTPNLNQGYNTVNGISVTYTAASNTFNISFNGNATDSFIDASFTGGQSGYFASVGDGTEENFPDTPADIRFARVQPGVDP